MILVTQDQFEYLNELNHLVISAWPAWSSSVYSWLGRQHLEDRRLILLLMSPRIWLFLRSGLRLYYLFVVSLPSCLCWREVKSQRAEAAPVAEVQLELQWIGRWLNFQARAPQRMGCEQSNRPSCPLAREKSAGSKGLRRKATNSVIAGSWIDLCPSVHSFVISRPSDHQISGLSSSGRSKMATYSWAERRWYHLDSLLWAVVFVVALLPDSSHFVGAARCPCWKPGSRLLGWRWPSRPWSSPCLWWAPASTLSLLILFFVYLHPGVLAASVDEEHQHSWPCSRVPFQPLPADILSKGTLFLYLYLPGLRHSWPLKGWRKSQSEQAEGIGLTQGLRQTLARLPSAWHSRLILQAPAPSWLVQNSARQDQGCSWPRSSKRRRSSWIPFSNSPACGAYFYFELSNSSQNHSLFVLMFQFLFDTQH